MTWKPIETAPKDRPIDLWTEIDGRLVDCRWWPKFGAFVFEDHPVPIDRITHWKEIDKGPGQEEGEVRWMGERNGVLLQKAHETVESSLWDLGYLRDRYPDEKVRVVRVRIVREEE